MKAREAIEILRRKADGADGDDAVALNMAVKMLEREAQIGWAVIPALKPADSGKYLACTSNGALLIAKYDSDKSEFCGTKRPIVAWRFLPEPYEA